jgi:hypothetical protein
VGEAEAELSVAFTKDELRDLFQEFLFIIGSDVPDGQIKAAWERFCQVKLDAKLKAELEALQAQGFIQAVYDQVDEEWCYTLTAKGVASQQREKLERLGV